MNHDARCRLLAACNVELLYGYANSFGREAVVLAKTLKVISLRVSTRGGGCAIASARTMGQGEPSFRQVATEAMRHTMDSIPMRGTIVIGEGERDERPCSTSAKKWRGFPDGREVPEVDIAVDPLEWHEFCATGAPGSIIVLAASERGGLLNAPDCYNGEDCGRTSCKNAVELDAPVVEMKKHRIWI